LPSIINRRGGEETLSSRNGSSWTIANESIGKSFLPRGWERKKKKKKRGGKMSRLNLPSWFGQETKEKGASQRGTALLHLETQKKKKEGVAENFDVATLPGKGKERSPSRIRSIPCDKSRLEKKGEKRVISVIRAPQDGEKKKKTEEENRERFFENREKADKSPFSPRLARKKDGNAGPSPRN